MRIDTTHFPLVTVLDEPSDLDWELQLAALLERGERFVLITHRSSMPDERGNPEEKRRWALWLKKNKSLLAVWCAGSIVVASGPAIALALGLLMRPLAKAFGFPVLVVEPSHLEAKAHQLLSGR